MRKPSAGTLIIAATHLEQHAAPPDDPCREVAQWLRAQAMASLMRARLADAKAAAREQYGLAPTRPKIDSASERRADQAAKQEGGQP